MLFITPITQGKENGKFNSGSGCGCHSQSGSTIATASLSGTPAQYVAGQTYTLSVGVSGGVSGSNGGFSLDVDKGTFSYIGFAVNVNSAGNSATHSISGVNQRSWSFDWTAPSSGSGTANFQLASMTANGNGGTSGDRWATLTSQVPESVPSNQPPSASNALLTPTGAKTADDLTLAYSFSDPDGDSESGTTITWYRDSIALPQGTIPAMVVDAAQTSKNQQWYAEITPSDGQDSGATITSNTVTIQNTPPTFTTPVISPSQPTTDDDLIFSQTNSDADQDTITTETLWYLNGALVSELNNELSVPSLATRDGDEWYVEVRITDSEDTTQWQTSQTITIGSSEPVNTQPTVSSLSIQPLNPTTLDSLSVDFISNDVDGDTIVDIQIEWYLDGVLMTGLTDANLDSSYTSKLQDWKAHIRVNDGTDWSQWTPSPTVTIINSKPILNLVELDTYQALTMENITMSYTMIDVDGDIPSTPQVKWFKNGSEQTNLENEITLPNILTSKGENWTVSVKANDGQDLSDEELTASVLIINSIPTTSLELTSISSNLVLSIINEDLDGDDVSNEIHWFRNGFKEGSLSGELNVPEQYLGAGQTWSVQVTPNDGETNGSEITAEIIIENLVPIALIEIESINLWDNEEITINAEKSSDADGRITTYSWQWSDNNDNSGTGSGKSFTFLPEGNVVVSLTVYDELGASGFTTSNFQTEPGPKVESLTAISNGEKVELSWNWGGPNATFEILRNGASIAIISETNFVDSPLISGFTDYMIVPIIDQNGLNAGSATLDDFLVEPVNLESNNVSSTGGLISGIIFVLISLGALGLAFFERRD